MRSREDSTTFQSYQWYRKWKRQQGSNQASVSANFVGGNESPYYVRYRHHIQQTNPDRYQAMKMKQRECMRKLRAKRRAERLEMDESARNQPPFLHGINVAIDMEEMTECGAEEEDEVQ
ncbi:hypothetical protein ACOMHN_022985 [Nucella lapillus]